MAHIEGPSSGKKVSVDVNIVPFIDLMSVLIIFLLITAVWQQVSMIQVGSSIYGKRSQGKTTTALQNMEVPLRLDILQRGHRLVVGRQRFEVLKKSNEYDLKKLGSLLKKIKDQYPNKKDVTVTIGDGMKYLYLINGMDALLEAGFPEIVIATGGAR